MDTNHPLCRSQGIGSLTENPDRLPHLCPLLIPFLRLPAEGRYGRWPDAGPVNLSVQALAWEHESVAPQSTMLKRDHFPPLLLPMPSRLPVTPLSTPPPLLPTTASYLSLLPSPATTKVSAQFLRPCIRAHQSYLAR